MSNNTSTIVSKVWSFSNPLREIGALYCDFGAQLTFEKTNKAISQSLQQAETLRQRILKKAFEGKLE